MLLHIFSWFWQWKNFENRLIFDKVKRFNKNCAILGHPVPVDERDQSWSSSKTIHDHYSFIVTTSLFLYLIIYTGSKLYMTVCRRTFINLLKKNYAKQIVNGVARTWCTAADGKRPSSWTTDVCSSYKINTGVNVVLIVRVKTIVTCLLACNKQ